MDDLILFIHVFRSGGSTLSEMLRRSLGKDFARTTIEQLVAYPKGHENAQVILGHFCWGVHLFFSRACRYSTVLRHPVDRRISAFFSGNEGYTADQFIEAYRSGRSPGHSNIATRLVAGTKDRNLMQAGYFEMVARQPDQQMLEQAKCNLNEFAFVGIYEKYAHCLYQMQKRFGWPHHRILHENQSKSRPDVVAIPPDVIDRIEEIDLYDLELYRHASRLFTCTT